MSVEDVNERHKRIKRAMRRCVVDKLVPIQRQDSTTDQLMDLWMVAAKLGMYDAADWLWKNAQLEDRESRSDETRRTRFPWTRL